jgi:hypothetical protein
MNKRQESDYGKDLFGLDPDGRFGFDQEDVLRRGDLVLTLSQIMSRIEKFRDGAGLQEPGPNTYWFSLNGMPCEILRVSGGGWQKGKLRFRLEFIPDEPAAFEQPKPVRQKSSPLDDLRSELDLGQ